MFSFTKRKKQTDVHQLVRRLIDTTSPNLLQSGDNSRWENRSNRTVPVLMAPFENQIAAADRASYAVTKDISSQGVALVLHQAFQAEAVVLGFWVEPSPRFVLGHIRQNVPLGGGFWHVGVELVERLGIDDHPTLNDLVPLADGLVASASSHASLGPIVSPECDVASP